MLKPPVDSMLEAYPISLSLQMFAGLRPKASQAGEGEGPAEGPCAFARGARPRGARQARCLTSLGPGIAFTSGDSGVPKDVRTRLP